MCVLLGSESIAAPLILLSVSCVSHEILYVIIREVLKICKIIGILVELIVKVARKRLKLVCHFLISTLLLFSEYKRLYVLDIVAQNNKT